MPCQLLLALGQQFKDTRPIIAVCGDGGLCQYLAEFTTLVKYKIPAKIIVLNNNELGKITKEQKSGGWETWETDLMNPDFAQFATSCGGLGIKVNKKDQLGEAINALLSFKGPALLEVISDSTLI